MSRDFQKSKVYAWERQHVSPRDRSKVPFGALQGMVDAIWADLGLLYPPEVQPMPKTAKRVLATGCRMTLRFPEQTPSWVVLHEIGHALASDIDGNTDHHGPIYVGHYLNLLERYMPQIPQSYLMLTLQQAGIEFVRNPKPLFL